MIKILLRGVAIFVVTYAIAFMFLTQAKAAQPQAGVNMNCTLVVPANPLSAVGLSTPYQLQATDPAAGPCNEAHANQASFVQAAIYDPAKKSLSIYNPLVIDAGSTPAVAPVIPVLPVGATVGIWFGSNANNLTLQGSTPTALAQGRCINGLGKSVFGQFASCNGAALLAQALRTIQSPALGVGKDGQVCPTVRDFTIVDQDQSDNVTTTYLVNTQGQTAQNNALNVAAVQGASILKNASDNRLLTLVDAAVGCVPFMAPDLANPGTMTTALPLDEISAAQHQKRPVALIPSLDPMVLVNGQPNILKRSLYRINVGQSVFASGNTTAYCAHIRALAPARILLDKPFTNAVPSPDPAVGVTLFDFIASRLNATYGPAGLNCMKLLNQPQPLTLTVDGNGVVTDAALTPTTATQGKGGDEAHRPAKSYVTAQDGQQ